MTYLARIEHQKNRNTAYITFVMDFRKLVNLPKHLYFWERNDDVYFSFRRHLDYCNIRRSVQRVGRNRVFLRVPIPIQLRRKHSLDRYKYVHVEQVLDIAFRCRFEDNLSIIPFIETIRMGHFTNETQKIRVC